MLENGVWAASTTTLSYELDFLSQALMWRPVSRVVVHHILPLQPG